jgi:hypothetical protein
MAMTIACAEVPCSDVSGVSVLVPLFPVAVVIAFLLAWPLARVVPRRPMPGWLLVAVGFGGYLWFSGGPLAPLVVAFALAVVGFAFVRGHAEGRLPAEITIR